MNRLDNLYELINRLNVEGIVISSFPNIFYFSKFTSEDCILYINKKEAYLITDSRYTLQAKRQAKNFKIIIRKSTYTNELKNLINGGKVLFEENIPYFQYESFTKNIDATFSSINIDYLRNIKDISEINKIKKATQIADKCYKHILSFIKPGMKETTVSNEMIRYMKELGASKESFETIVASGKRGALPHGVASNKIIKDGEFVTLDFGCVYKGYCSDITRSFMIGKASKEMIRVYNVVKKAQELATKSVKAGIKASEVDKVARDYIERKGYGRYFTHSTGHGVGIEVHDPISVSKYSDTILEENMIITIEPGIYIPKLGGIRIEDDVLVKKDGYEVLTKATKKLISIEK
jgi:Xaa-Pro aminopeptidase